MADVTSLRFLLVDDDEVDVMNVQRAFEKNRVANGLFVATDGKDALEKLRAGEVPIQSLVVLLDLNMPRMSGTDFLREVRKDPTLAPLPIIVLTTSSEEKDTVEAHHLNVTGYLPKPVEFTELADLIAALRMSWNIGKLPEM
jgi:CheY-like chemotaxis protein